MPGYANRGLLFETLIDHMNIVYRNRGIALVQKVSAAWVPIRGSDGKIVSAKVDRKSGVDYMGVWQHGALAFEAKSTTNKNRWSLNNITLEQMAFLNDHRNINSCAMQFVLLGFVSLSVYYLLDIEFLKPRWDRWKNGGRASIAISDLKGLPSSDMGYPLDYLALLAQHIA